MRATGALTPVWRHPGEGGFYPGEFAAITAGATGSLQLAASPDRLRVD